MGGDNSVYEFSAWQKAAESDMAREYDADVYLFVTSAFIKKKFYAMPVITDTAIRMVMDNKLLGGNVRTFSFNATYGGESLSPYVSTHCFFLSRETLNSLGTLISERSASKFIKQEYTEDVFTENEIWNDKLKKYLVTTLTHKYHRKGIKFNRQYHDFFKRKIWCIVNEMLLAVRVKQSGGRIVDMTPFPSFCSSPLTLFVFGTTVRPFQFVRKITLQFMYILLCNKLAEYLGLRDGFMKWCARSVERALREVSGE